MRWELSGWDDERFALASPVSTVDQTPFLVKEADGRLVEASKAGEERPGEAGGEEAAAVEPEDDGKPLKHALAWLRITLRLLKTTRFAQAKAHIAACERWQRVTVTGSGRVADEKDKPKLTAYVDGQQQAEVVVDKWPGKAYPNMSKQGVVLFGSSRKHERLRHAVYVRLVVVKTKATSAKEAFEGGLATDFTSEDAERLLQERRLRDSLFLSQLLKRSGGYRYTSSMQGADKPTTWRHPACLELFETATLVGKGNVGYGASHLTPFYCTPAAFMSDLKEMLRSLEEEHEAWLPPGSVRACRYAYLQVRAGMAATGLFDAPKYIYYGNDEEEEEDKQDRGPAFHVTQVANLRRKRTAHVVFLNFEKYLLGTSEDPQILFLVVSRDTYDTYRLEVVNTGTNAHRFHAQEPTGQRVLVSSSLELHGIRQERMCSELWWTLLLKCKRQDQLYQRVLPWLVARPLHEMHHPPPSGLRWRNAGEAKPTGSELSNDKLSAALEKATEFSQLEWAAFGIHDLGMDHFVKAGTAHFRPVASPSPRAKWRVLSSEKPVGFVAPILEALYYVMCAMPPHPAISPFPLMLCPSHVVFAGSPPASRPTRA